ncbi:MAG: 4-(cytidine 5'-diphospho)-2-C-methyl-D-erythritol kinase [Ignavibacteriae bacterium]|nr:4-(cytidine 5'-diphospho)-2-C-methyl-D-erythritol kinase [Ignavibacteriota bacterium]
MIIKNAYAKINIGLRILRKRPDGYHDLETVFHRVNVKDELKFEEAKLVTVNSSHPHLPNERYNLCARAAMLYKRHFGVKKGVSISLKKNIPIGAGLGGGSADAAATLLAINELWNQNYSAEELLPLAATLGSDIPFFLKNESAYATGRGEELLYFKLDIPYWIVVVYPNVHVSTPWAYSQLKVNSEKLKVGLNNILLQHINEPKSWSQTIQNDFEENVFAHHPFIAEVKLNLIESGAVFAQMSGSGSSVYGMFYEEETAKRVVEEMKVNFPVFLTPPNFHPEN